MLRISKRTTPQVLGFGLTRQQALSRAHTDAARGLAGTVAAQAGADASSAGTAAAAAQSTATTANATANTTAAKLQNVCRRWTARLSGAAGSVTIAGLSEPDANYAVVATPYGYSGGVPVNAFIISQVVKATSYFSVSFAAPPGGSNWIDWDLVMIRPQ